MNKKFQLNKMKEKYCSIPIQFRATIWITICQFVQKGIGMITTPVFTRLLPTAEYGRASTFHSWADIIIPLITFSCWRGMMNLFIKDKNKDQVLSSTITLSIVIAFFWSIVIALFQPLLTDFMSFSDGLLWGLVLYCLAQNIYSAWTVRMQYDYKYKPLIMVSLIHTIITSLGGFLLVYFISRTAELKLFPQIACLTIIGICITVISITREKKVFCKDIWLFNLGFAIPLIPHYLSEMILQSSDRIMINNLCSSSEAAIYSVAYSVGSLINLITSTVNSVFAPYQYQKIKSGEYGKLAKITNYVIGFVAACLCGLMLFGREIIWIFGGDKYYESASLIIPICIGVFFNYLFQLFARLQEYYEQKYTIVIASISCAILNIVLNFIYIGLFGYKAAAYTTFVCYFIFCTLHYFFYKKICKKKIGREIYNAKVLAGISILLVALAMIIKLIEQFLVVKYVLLIVVLIIVLLKKEKIIGFIERIRRDQS